MWSIWETGSCIADTLGYPPIALLFKEARGSLLIDLGGKGGGDGSFFIISSNILL